MCDFQAMSFEFFRMIFRVILTLIFVFAIRAPDYPMTFLDYTRENSIFTHLSPTVLGPRLAALLSWLHALWSSASWETLSLPQLRHLISSITGVLLSLDLSLTHSVVSSWPSRASRTGIPSLLRSTTALYDTVHSIAYPPVRQSTKDDASAQFFRCFCRMASILLTTIDLLSLAVHSLFVLDRWVKSHDRTLIAAGAECEWDCCGDTILFAAVAVVGFLGFAPVWVLLWWAVEYVSEARRYLQLAAQDEGAGGRVEKADLKRGGELLDAARKDREEGKRGKTCHARRMNEISGAERK